MKRVLFLFFILYAFNFKAQEDEEFIFIQRNFNNPFRIVLFNDALFLSKKPIQFKLWEEGFLTIDDFQSTDYPEKDNLSLLKTGFLKYYYAFVPFKLKIKSRDTIFFYTKVYLLIDKSQSWISKEVNVIQTLNYFNGLYDLLQLYAKLFEYEANRFFPNVYGIQRGEQTA
ncbi:MAG: hypothetical protein KatS3mg027_0399 [Bacteroidia bacterium]|nr:MAG: hypothetical protein KatS3mg027_0399 [Bacteroidia bacterium]